MVIPVGRRQQADADVARNGSRPRPRGLRDRMRRPRHLGRWSVVAVGLVIIVGVLIRQLSLPAAPPGPPAPAVSSASHPIAHGVVAPVSQARVGTLGGGVLLGLSVSIGDVVEAQRELARVRGPADTVEILTAPFAGTVTGLLAHTGDTLVPGAGVLLVADLRRLQVESNDVDEFLIGRVQPGQSVTLQIEALDRRELSGRVRTVALQPQSTPGGDQHYPVTIDLGGTPPDLRPGMSVRIVLPD
jgi:multidrug efflux pump subunit AcrA (membrane-fusion protein)